MEEVDVISSTVNATAVGRTPNISIACPPVAISTTFRMGKISGNSLDHVFSGFGSGWRGVVSSDLCSFRGVGSSTRSGKIHGELSFLSYCREPLQQAGVGKTPGGPPSYSVSVTASVGSLVKHLNISAPPPSIAGIVFPLIPKIEIAIDECGYFSKPFPPYSEYTSNISASATANPTWGAGVISRVHCWTVLGVLTFEILVLGNPDGESSFVVKRVELI